MTEVIRQQLTTQLFGGLEASAETLLSVLRVAKAEKASSKKYDDKAKAKWRLLCLTVNRKGKIRIHKILQLSNGTFTIGTTWSLEEIRAIEIIDYQTFVITLNKSYQWSVDDVKSKNDFILSLIKLCRKYVKKQPQLKNIDEQNLKGEPKEMNSQSQSKTVPKSQVKSADPYEEEWNESNETQLMNLDELMSDFDWKVTGDAAALEAKLQAELVELESSKIYDLIASNDMTDKIVSQIDSTLDEILRVEQWLGFYTSQIQEMAQEVATIDMKNQGLQTQTANQRLLIDELKNLFTSLDLPQETITVLRNESLESSHSIMRVEDAAQTLQACLLQKFDENIQEMNAVREKQDEFKTLSANFAKRFYDFFNQMLLYQTETCLADKSRLSRRGQLKLVGLENLEEYFSRYRGLILWLKEMEERFYNELQTSYIQSINKVYRKEIRELVDTTKTFHLQKPPHPDEIDFVFTPPPLTATSGLHQLTKVSGSSKPNLLSPSPGTPSSVSKSLHTKKDGIKLGGDNVLATSSVLELGAEDKLTPESALMQTLNIVIPVMCREQNFMYYLLHVNNPKSYATRSPTASRWVEKLNQKGDAGKDEEVMKILVDLMDGVFDGIPIDIMNLVDAGLKISTSSSIGMLAFVEHHLGTYMGTNQFYIRNILETIRKKVLNVWKSFMNEQVKAIEETRISSKKRTGIFPFIKTFPRFLERVEGLVEPSPYEARLLANEAYVRLATQVVDSMELAAKTADASADDKEQLNFYVLMIENTHFFLTEVKPRQLEVLKPFIDHSTASYNKHLNAYVLATIRKPLGFL